MNPFERSLEPNSLDQKQSSDFFMKLHSYISLAESENDLNNRLHLAQAYLIGWIHGGGDIEQAKTFEELIHATRSLCSHELRQR
ncbi:hypothetical protein AO067_20335 [Pseudomonas viridiflava ICMP 13104]|uniref:Uncharacterized protein n=1 Tax=Pseudomonas viridiflava ICMP 13104 TaxID=1198305 RepID=A0A0W0H2C9_PSEVI|nr:hypothetical protein AO067_20335 [Pseudomonas viridiflava ICMP 13104]